MGEQNRVVAEIDLERIRQNVALIRSHVGLRVEVMPVIKADAYGHGAAEVARTLVNAGVEWLGVATVAEGSTLRDAYPAANICVLAPFGRDDADEIVRQRLTPFLSDMEGARALSSAAHRLRGGVRAHLDVDTGMGRSGVLPERAARLAEYIARMPAILITGLTTHFPSAEDDPDDTLRQLATFLKAAEGVTATDTLLSHLHCANSAALLRYPATRLNMVRPGLLIYGIVPAVPADTPVPDLLPALTLKSRIALVRTLPAGHAISYGGTHILQRASRIATIPVGYGDGYPRALGNRGCVLVDGRRAPIVGRICMDVTLVDVTDIPNAVEGASVVLIGEQGDEHIRVEEIAAAIHTTEHDVTTRLTSRVPRVYKGGTR